MRVALRNHILTFRNSEIPRGWGPATKNLVCAGARIFVRRSVSHLRARATRHSENLESNFLGFPGGLPYLIKLNSSPRARSAPISGGAPPRKAAKRCCFAAPTPLPRTPEDGESVFRGAGIAWLHARRTHFAPGGN